MQIDFSVANIDDLYDIFKTNNLNIGYNFKFNELFDVKISHISRNRNDPSLIITIIISFATGVSANVFTHWLFNTLNKKTNVVRINKKTIKVSIEQINEVVEKELSSR